MSQKGPCWHTVVIVVAAIFVETLVFANSPTAKEFELMWNCSHSVKLCFGQFLSWKSLLLFYISRTLGHLNSLFLLKACTSLQMEGVSHIFLEQHHIETDAWQWNSKWPQFQGFTTIFCAPDCQNLISLAKWMTAAYNSQGLRGSWI